MATKKPKRAAAAAQSTVIDPQAAWPFPTTTKPSADAAADEKEVVDPAVEAADRREAFDAHADAIHGAGERVQVASMRLYTDPAQNIVQRLALEQLLESPFNPRTHYNQKDLQELADAIRGVGVMQAILVRPIPADGYEMKRGDETVQVYEIVFGHRRTRAAKLAGETDVPAIVRELTDAQAAQLQAIENVQRKDLDAVEEARGYAHYLKVHGVNKDQLAAEIGLSRSHVYARLKLATACDAVLDALRNGELYEENALRIARLPTEKLQLKALETIRKDYRYDGDDGGKVSVRRIQEMLAEKFSLKLREAIFDTKDAQLLPLAGPCTTCPKRTGNAPEFADLATDTEKNYGGGLKHGPDLCTDPDCFDAKKKQHLANQAEKLVAKGKTVVTGAKARAAISADGTVKGAYVPLKEVKALLSDAKKAGKGDEIQTVTIQDPRSGKTVEAVARDSLKAAGVKVKEPPKPRGHDYEEERRKREEADRKKEAKAAEETKINTALLAAVRQAAAGQPLSTLALQLIATAAVAGVDYDHRRLLATLHDCKSLGELEKKVGSMPPERLTTLLLDCALVHGVVVNPWRGDKPAALLAAAKHYGVDVAQVRQDVEAKAADTKTEDLLKVAEAADADEEEAAA